MKNSDELKRINLVNTGVSAILLASDSGLQTVSIRNKKYQERN
jgi:hypothetical protein